MAQLHGLHSQSRLGDEQPTVAESLTTLLSSWWGQVSLQPVNRHLHLFIKAVLQALHVIMQDVTFNK